MKARELFEAALAEDGLLMLDVRNAEEHARWKVEEKLRWTESFLEKNF